MGSENKVLAPREFQAIDTIPRFFSVPQLLNLAISTGLVISVSQRITEQEAQFTADFKRYGLRNKSERAHRYGDGGELGDYNFLIVNGKDVLVSMSFNSYDTLSDDSEERGTGRIIKTSRLAVPGLPEGDLVARLMLDNARNIIPKFLKEGEKREERAFTLVRDFLKGYEEEIARVYSHYEREDWEDCRKCGSPNVFKGTYYSEPEKREQVRRGGTDLGDFHTISVCLDCLDIKETGYVKAIQDRRGEEE